MPIPSLRSVFVLGFAVAVSAARPADASLVVALDLPTMVSRAEHVAVVDVMSVSSAWDARHERILTTIDLAVVETWKGTASPASHVRIVQRGGSVGDTEMVVYGMTRFQPGERALVFLEGAVDHAHVVGMSQGKRSMRKDTATGRWMVHAPDRSGAAFVKQPGSTLPSPVFDARIRPIDDLRTEIRALIATPTPTPTPSKGR